MVAQEIVRFDYLHIVDLSRLEDFAGRSGPEVTLARMDAINKARKRITTTNVAPLLTIEAMAAGLI